ncbi:hypothetical protein EJ08DRAFT_600394, partial [Tothia fuscella]
LEHTINPGNRILYLVITTYCYYNHIRRSSKLPPTNVFGNQKETLPTTILSSSYNKAFLTPYENLNKHSCASFFELSVPHYTIGIRADDLQVVKYKHTLNNKLIESGLTILNTPGHTPDSLL